MRYFGKICFEHTSVIPRLICTPSASNSASQNHQKFCALLRCVLGQHTKLWIILWSNPYLDRHYFGSSDGVYAFNECLEMPTPVNWCHDSLIRCFPHQLHRVHRFSSATSMGTELRFLLYFLLKIALKVIIMSIVFVLHAQTKSNSIGTRRQRA